MFWMIFWKEWRENLWKLWFCGVASVAFTITLFRLRILPDFTNCVLISFVQMFVAPVVYSMDIFSGEISNNTIHLLFKIPVKRWMLFFGKYLASAIGITLIFLVSGILMELLSHGREATVFYLLKTNLLFGAAGLLLFTWFCPFGCQNRSEAASLAEMFSVFIGWGIILFWANVCQVHWAQRFIPYSFVMVSTRNIEFTEIIFFEILALVAALAIGCYRYVSIRRYI